jgi:hypothetical protein
MDEIIIESIQKMISLGMDDEDIVASLVDAGVDYDYAKKTLDSFKNKKSDKKSKQKSQLTEDSTNQDDVWSEGVLTIINQKLDEITKKQLELDTQIKDSVKQITSTEISKMKTIIDSQRALLVSKMDMSLASRVKDIKTEVEETLKVLQDVNLNTQKKLDNFDKIVANLEDLKITLQTQMDAIQNIKQTAFNTIEELKSKSNQDLDNFYNQYRKKSEEIITKTNSTLNISAKILDNLISSAKLKIDDTLNAKIEEFLKDFQSKLNVEDIKLALDKLNTIKDLEGKINAIVGTKILELKNSLEFNKYDDSIMDLNKRFMDLEKSLKLNSNTNLDEINSKLDELMLYKEQNSNLMKKIMSEKKDKK